jgi:soluble cytochrome b562
MNKLIINSFGIGHNHVEFSKKLYDLNEVFFSLLETMKQKRSEIDIARFEKEKRKYTDPSDYKDYHKINFELINQLNNRDKWGQKFMLEQYQYKIPEKEFQKFKKSEKQKYKEKATNTAKKVSSLILNLDADEYEPTDDVTHNYRSTKSNISSINFKRIVRLLKILKYQEDEEQTGYIAIKPDFLRKEQRLIENEMLNIIGKSGKPRFVKNILKPKTVDKYKSISGDYFGLPV